MNRRHYLGLLGAAATGTLAGCYGKPKPSPDVTPSPPVTPSSDETPPTTPHDDSLTAPVTRHGLTFERVLHAVDDLGMDPDGHEAIDEALDAAYGDGTLVVFPPGTYLATQQHHWEANVSGFGILGLGHTHREVEFVFPPGNELAADPANYWFLNVRNGRDHLFENVTVQQTDDAVTGVGLVFFLADGLRVVDVELAGFNPRSEHDPGNGIIAAITDVDGVGVIRRFTCVGGGVTGVYPQRKTPVGAFENHRGELRILEPHIEESGSHSLYVSRTNGCVRVEDGLFVNNDNSNLRMSGGGHPTKRSWAKRCRIVIDTDRAAHLPPGEAYQGARGLWVESGQEPPYGHTDLLVEDLTIVARSNASPHPLLQVDHDHGALTLRNATFTSTVEGSTPLDVRSVDRSIVRRPYGLTLDGVSVRTEATTTTTGYAVRVHRRPGSIIRNLTIDVLRGSVGGLQIRDSKNVVVSETRVVTHFSELQKRLLLGADPGLAESEFGENSGIVIDHSDGFVVRNSNVDVPGERIRVVASTPRGK